MSQRQIRGAGRSCQTVASFLLKTYEILDHGQFQHIICWDRDNIGFIVKDVLAFTREILPKYFRHSNFSSFVRQLNMYDFHKVKQENDNLVFKNPQFRKNQQQLLKEIRRKASKRQFTHTRNSSAREKNNTESEKYMNTLKSLKKVIEAEINNSCNGFEQGLKTLDDNNASNNLKLKYMKSVETSPEMAIDHIFKLKEECYQYFNKIENWLNETLENNHRKAKSVNIFLGQIQKREEAPYSAPLLDSNKQSMIKSQEMVN